MKVTNDRPVTGPQRKGGTSRVGSSTFSKLVTETEGADDVQSGASVGPAQSVDALLTLQEVPDGTTGRRRAFKRGQSLLDHLDAIRVGLLTGSLSRERLAKLAQMLRQPRDEALDPAVAELLDEIELRAEVELAKLSRAS
jgi:hypothetical protein